MQPDVVEHVVLQESTVCFHIIFRSDPELSLLVEIRNVFCGGAALIFNTIYTISIIYLLFIFTTGPFSFYGLMVAVAGVVAKFAAVFFAASFTAELMLSTLGKAS